MRKVPEVDKVAVDVIAEDGLLDPHLHLDDFCFQVTVDLALGFFYQFSDVLLTEDAM